MNSLTTTASHAAALESARLAALSAFDIMDTPAEEAFDRITRMASELFDTPLAMISLIDASRQWFKSRLGPVPAETPRAISFCHHTIQGDRVMVVPDAARDPRFANSPLVNSGPHIRFYAGAPLRLSSGLRLGAMCICDTKPRQLSEREQRRLAVIAQIVVDEMELRLKGAQLEEARAAAVAAARVKSDFVANVSHELRTPLTSIIGFAGILKATGELGARERHYVERIYDSSQSLLALINDVLDFSRLESGRLKLERSDVDLTEFTEGLVRQFRNLADEKGLKLEHSTEPGVPKVWYLEKQATKQILTNLIANAIKFTDRGHVRLETAQEDGRLIFRVRDTGIGIAEDQLERVFERFERGDSSTARKYSGTGLGLAISRQLAEQMGAVLTVSSVVGSGTTFTLSIPAAARPELGS
jgi:signal transduction histidine kinase